MIAAALQDPSPLRRLYVNSRCKRYRFNLFARFLGREPEARDLIGDVIDRYAIWLKTSGLSENLQLDATYAIRPIWRKAFEAGLTESGPPGLPAPEPGSLREFFYSLGTEPGQRHRIKIFNRFAKAIGREPGFEDLNTVALEQFKIWLKGRDFARKEQRNAYCAIRRAWRHAFDAGLATSRPDSREAAKARYPVGTFEHAYYERVRPTIVKPTYRNGHDRAVSRFVFWRGGPTRLDGMTDELIDQFERALQAAGFAKNNMKDYPQVIRRILRQIDKNLCRAPRHGFEGTPYIVGPPGTLTHFARQYCLNRDLAKQSIAQIKYSVLCLEKFLCRQALLEDLNADTIAEWIGARLDEGLARRTVHGRRGNLLCLWRQARRQKLLPPVEDVRLVKVPKPIPRAWFENEFAKLLAGIGDTRGRADLGNVILERHIVLWAFVLTGYYTGLRPQDLIALRSDEVMADGTLVVRQQKTGEPITIDLPADCRQAIAATQPEGRELVFPLGRQRVWKWLNSLIEKAGLDGSVKWLRRTGATRCEQVQPGSAKAYLGHLTDGLAYKHYVDRRQIKNVRPVPPSLVGIGGGA